MKEQYYLISQLPDISVSGEKTTLPITEKYFKDLCLRFVGNKEAVIATCVVLLEKRGN